MEEKLAQQEKAFKNVFDMMIEQAEDSERILHMQVNKLEQRVIRLEKISSRHNHGDFNNQKDMSNLVTIDHDPLYIGLTSERENYSLISQLK